MDVPEKRPKRLLREVEVAHHDGGNLGPGAWIWGLGFRV